jgi:outer membrane protein assembly factor BamB
MMWRKIAFLSSAFVAVLLLVSCRETAVSNRQAVSRPEPSSPSLFVLSSHGDIQAYHTDGTLLWQASADAQSDSIPSTQGTHLLNAGQMVYVATDAIHAYDRLTGQLHWQHDLSSSADTMLLVGQRLFVACNGSITAWDAITGALQWQQSNVVLQATTALAHDSHTLFVAGLIGSQVVALNLQSGASMWSIQGDPGESIKALFVESDELLIQKDGALTSVQKTTGRTIWHCESQIQILFIDSAAEIIYTAYIDVSSVATSSGLQALRLNTGKQLWNVSFPINPGERGAISSTGIVWANQTSITSWGLNGKQRWQLPYVGPPITQVMSVEQRSLFLLIAQDGTMTALDALTGHQRWQAALGSGDGFQMVIQPALIWIVNQNTGRITAFDLSGKMRWSLDGPSSVNEIIVEQGRQ